MSENQTRAAKAKEAHQKATEARADAINQVRASYKKIKDEPAFLDIMRFIREMSAYHSKMAKDGVGYQQTGERDESGQPIQRTVFYDQPKRISELDKAAGIEEIEAYLERQITDEALKPFIPKKIVS